MRPDRDPQVPVRRELNELEYFNWCVGQPYNMVVAVQIRGDLSAARLRDALDRAQRRHPLLGVDIALGPGGLPWFSSEGVGPIPLTVLEHAPPEATSALVERELTAPFAMGQAQAPRLPLMRVSLLVPSNPAEPVSLVLTAQHVIADGLSMVFLVRDLLRFMEEPAGPVEVLDAPASAQDLLPARVRRRIPTSPRLFRAVLTLARLYIRLRFGHLPPAPPHGTQHHRSWQLTAEQTARLRARCRREGVSVQSAICTALVPAFRFIHTPVNLRPLLARPVGEALGLFVGSADRGMKYRPRRGFWGNARRFHHRLRSALRNPFGLFRLFSKAVAPEAVRELGPMLMAIASVQRPFAVTNLGELDGSGLRLGGRDLGVESFYGAVTGVVDSSVLTVYTIRGRMHLHLLATESGARATAVRDDVDRALAQLLFALEEPAPVGRLSLLAEQRP
jgi:hypothetical protein